MKENMRPFSVNLEQWQLEKLKIIAKDNDRTIGFLIRRFIEDALPRYSSHIEKPAYNDPNAVKDIGQQ